LKEERFTIISRSEQETILIGEEIGSLLAEGDVMALVGELGSGKTWLTKGIARGLGISPATVVTSPSFALVNEYQGRVTLFHMDVYRLETLSEVLSAGMEEYVQAGGVVVLEWANRWPEILPEHTITVELLILDDHSRKITLVSRSPRAAEILGAIEKRARQMNQSPA
jgi:tRNA threonylcarbamoyladenosine biosynthesis protein TsaE